jgi:hypothetical protein
MSEHSNSASAPGICSKRFSCELVLAMPYDGDRLVAAFLAATRSKGQASCGADALATIPNQNTPTRLGTLKVLSTPRRPRTLAREGRRFKPCRRRQSLARRHVHASGTGRQP